MNAVLYIHGKNGSAAEAEHYRPLFPDCEVVGLDYRGATPWEAGPEIAVAAAKLKDRCGELILIANSIGAFFAMNAGIETLVQRAFFISPVVDMEKLISGMMKQASVTEDELKRRRTVPTGLGEDLSWDYLCYVREHPLRWSVPTEILYGRNDCLTSYETVAAFADAHNIRLTVMEDGEHWFHTPEQILFLDRWIMDNI